MAREAEENQAENNAFMTAYRLSGEAKVEGSLEFIDTLLEAGSNVAQNFCFLRITKTF